MKNKRKWLLLLIDICMYIAVAVFTGLLDMLAGGGTHLKPEWFAVNAAIFLTSIMLVRFLFRSYSNLWRYANSKIYLQIVIADAIGGIVALLITYIAEKPFFGFWQSVSLVVMFDVLTLSSRFMYQQYYRHLNNMGTYDINKIGVAIVGAGQVGSLLAEELSYNSASHYRPICFIDRDEAKSGSLICGLRVYHENNQIIEWLKKQPIQEIFLALPSIDGDTTKKLLDFYSQTGCKVKMYDYRGDEDHISDKKVREIRIEDLLFRDALTINDDKVRSFYRGKTILVTGGGGSIGSELCRQIAKCAPKKLIVFDIYENNAYDLQQELIRAYGKDLDLAVEIGSVRDRKRLNAVFANYRPEIVFHAAAHKHVPLMEHSNCEAIKNNVMGTYNTADMAEKYEVKKFILISTDKAVNPTNIMGASKRMCEMVIQCRTDSKTVFSAVRFGNVLGSNGSVIPLFRKQIEEGGPITITDKRIIRYFMTIPEASQLVMQSGALAKRGELFVLDMGKPIKILELAENMIRLSGLRPYRDIQIREIGLRPGEKLYEELLIKTETLAKTENNMIFIELDEPLTRAQVDEKISDLTQAVKTAENEIASDAIKKAMKKAVPTYREPDEINCNAKSSEEMKAVAD